MAYIDASTLPEQLSVGDAEDYQIMLDEAVERMRNLDMSENAIKALQSGDVWMSEGIGALYEIEDGEYAAGIVEDVLDKGMFPYHVIHDMTNFGEMFSVLVVGSYPEEWEYDRESLEDGYALADVYNKNGDFDDLGSIGIRPSIGGLVRTA